MCFYIQISRRYKNDASFTFLEDSFHQFGSKQHLFFIIIFLFYVYGHVCVCVYHSGSRVADGFELPCRCWEWNTGPLEGLSHLPIPKHCMILMQYYYSSKCNPKNILNTKISSLCFRNYFSTYGIIIILSWYYQANF